jgi:hypothetical protein
MVLLLPTYMLMSQIDLEHEITVPAARFGLQNQAVCVIEPGRNCMETKSWALLVSTFALFICVYFVRKQQKHSVVAFATCPRCDARLPAPNPTGDGWTCEKCGCEVDAEGRPLN